MITCPACAVDIDVDEEELDESDLFDCTECGANLRVVSLKPLDLEVVKDDAAAADDEDGFDDDEEEDEDEDEEEEEKEDGTEDELEEEEDEEEEWN